MNDVTNLTEEECYELLIHSLEDDNYLEHHGILGQKWGVRRYQNPDGSLTEAGRKHQSKIDNRRYANVDRAEKRLNARVNDYNRILKKSESALWEGERDKAIKVNQKKSYAQQTLSDKELLERVGKKTLQQRVGILAGGSLVSAGSAATAILLDEFFPFVGIPVTMVVAGKAYYDSFH